MNHRIEVAEHQLMQVVREGSRWDTKNASALQLMGMINQQSECVLATLRGSGSPNVTLLEVVEYVLLVNKLLDRIQPMVAEWESR